MIDRVEVVAGQGTVIRYGGIVAWAGPAASPALISFLAQSARNLSGSGRGGRQMADHIAGVLRERDPEPQVAFAVVGPTDQGWASLLHGPVQAWDGQRWLAPEPAPGWLQAVISAQPAITVNARGSQTPALNPDTMWDLEAGVVPGSGFVLMPTERTVAQTVRAAPHEDETSVLAASPPTEVLEAINVGTEEVPVAVPRSEAGPEPPAEPEAGVVSPPGSIDLRDTSALDPLEPLPVGTGPDRPVPGAPIVAGVLCERGHLNRPGIGSCVRCGSAIPAKSYTVSGSRPALGCLVGDDGTVWRLDLGYVVGTDPNGDPTVRGGIARPLALSGGEVAPAHAEIRLKDWEVEVIDRSSPAGTCVYESGSSEWVRLKPYEPRILTPGTHVAFGRRIVTFVTPWVA